MAAASPDVVAPPGVASSEAAATKVQRMHLVLRNCSSPAVVATVAASADFRHPSFRHSGSCQAVAAGSFGSSGPVVAVV